MTPLLEQFLSEARDLLDEASKGFLALEDAPDDAATINTVFRAVHTIKGGSGLFEFAPMTQLVHAAEDVLDAVRHDRLTLSPEVVDLCFAALDRVGLWLQHVEATENLPDDAAAGGASLAASLRQLLTDATAADTGAADDSGWMDLSWLARVAPDDRAAASARLADGNAVLAVTYQPQENCFFGGEDPFAMVRQVPDLLVLHTSRHDGVEGIDGLDPYMCGVRFDLLTGAPRDAVEQVFRYVPDDVRVGTVPAEALEGPDEPDWYEEVENPQGRQALTRVIAEQGHILGLPCAPGDLAARLASVSHALHNSFTCFGAARQVERLASAAARANAEGDVAPLLALVETWQPRIRRARADAGPALTLVPAPGPAAAPERGQASGDAKRPGGTRAMKVDQAKVDQLMTLIGEMVVAKNALPYLARRAETVFGSRDLAREIKDQHAVIHRITEGLHMAIMQVRMLPVGSIFDRFPRLVRDLSRKLGKQISLVLEGEDTEADKNVIESLSDPLIHLVRNSADHGIESAEARVAAGKPPTGTIRLRAFQDNDRVVIEVIDDGAGIDPARVRRKAIERGLVSEADAAAMSDRQAVALVLEPGFSLAAEISDLSGRGVGMDVVRSAVEAAGGTLVLDSTPGVGTTVRLGLPLSMAVTRLLVIGLGDDLFGVPLESVVETLKVPVSAIRRLKLEEVLVWRGQLLPLRRLATLLGRYGGGADDQGEEEAVMVIRVGQDQVGIVVDRFLESTDVILKPLEGFLASFHAYTGTAILGDGRVLLALDFRELI